MSSSLIQIAVLKDSALTCIPSFLPLVASFPEQSKEVLDLIAEYADPREVILALNLQLTKYAEQADPYAVSDSEDDEDEDAEIDWESTFPQVEAVLDMYATSEFGAMEATNCSHRSVEDPAQHADTPLHAGRCHPVPPVYTWKCASRNGGDNVALAPSAYRPSRGVSLDLV